MSIEYHSHCQATVLSANGTGNQNGASWGILNGLQLKNLNSNWKNYFLSNKNTITEDFASILKIIDDNKTKVTQVQTVGTKIATINGTDIYAPNNESNGETQYLGMPDYANKGEIVHYNYSDYNFNTLFPKWANRSATQDQTIHDTNQTGSKTFTQNGYLFVRLADAGWGQVKLNGDFPIFNSYQDTFGNEFDLTSAYLVSKGDSITWSYFPMWFKNESNQVSDGHPGFYLYFVPLKSISYEASGFDPTKFHTVFFDPGAATSIEFTTKSLYEGSKFGKLPTYTLNGESKNDWYLNGTKVTSTDTFNSTDDITLTITQA